MSTPFPEPTDAASTRTEVMVRYLDYFRDQVASRVAGIPVDEQRITRVPSGWTPVQLLKHLTYVEHRWLEWGFEGAAVAEPWADRRDGRWFVDDTESLVDLLAAFRAQTRRSNAVIESHALTDVGQPGPGGTVTHRPPSNGCCCTSCRSTRGTWATSTSSPSSPGAPPASDPPATDLP